MGQDWGAAQPSAANPDLAADVTENPNAGAEESPVQGTACSPAPAAHGARLQRPRSHGVSAGLPSSVQLPCLSPVNVMRGKRVLETDKLPHSRVWDRPGQHSSTVLVQGDPSVPHRTDPVQLPAFWRAWAVLGALSAW